MEDLIFGQSDQAIDLEISIKANFPQSVLIFNINSEFLISIMTDRVPRSIFLVIIFFPFLEGRLWQACLDTIKCAPLIPHHYHCLVVIVGGFMDRFFDQIFHFTPLWISIFLGLIISHDEEAIVMMGD